MTGQDKVKKDQSPISRKSTKQRPEWAAGLRQLYDSVVEEPLPDSFDDLLSKFDTDE